MGNDQCEDEEHGSGGGEGNLLYDIRPVGAPLKERLEQVDPKVGDREQKQGLIRIFVVYPLRVLDGVRGGGGGGAEE